MSLLDNYTYQVDTEWTCGPNGRVTAEGLPTMDVSAPAEFHGEPGRWTPEHLLTAAAASCFMMTFLSIVRFQKIELVGFRMRAFARLEKLPGEGYRFTEITLVPEITAANEHVEKFLRAIEKAEKACFVVKSLRATVQVEPSFVTAPAEMAVQS